MYPLNPPHLEHGGLIEEHIIHVLCQVEVMEDVFHSLQQFSGLWHLCPAVISHVLLGWIGRRDSTEGVSVLQPLEIPLVHNEKGCSEELAEGAIQRMML